MQMKAGLPPIGPAWWLPADPPPLGHGIGREWLP